MDSLFDPVLPLCKERPVRLRIVYKNWRGEIGDRVIEPKEVQFGSNKWHPKPQWLLTAFDVKKQALRSFAMRDFLSVEVIEDDGGS